jgi:hypothetical protein
MTKLIFLSPWPETAEVASFVIVLAGIDSVVGVSDD